MYLIVDDYNTSETTIFVVSNLDTDIETFLSETFHSNIQWFIANSIIFK